MTLTSRSPKLMGLASCLRRASPNAAASKSGVARQDGAELVAAEPRQRVAGFEIARGAARDGEQRGIAERHAVRGVDRRQPVDVEQRHHETRRAGPPGRAERAFQPVEEQFAVGQAGQMIVDRVVQDALGRGAALGHVLERADHPHHVAAGVEHGRAFSRNQE